MDEKPASVAQVLSGLRDLFVVTTQFIVAAEAAMPEGSKGKEKLATVVAATQAYAGVIGLGFDLFDRLSPMIQAFANVVVARFNLMGWPKDPAASAQGPAPA